jgi:hypothetical protein
MQLIAERTAGSKEKLEWLAVAFCSHARPIAEIVPADFPYRGDFLLILTSILNHPIYAIKEIENFRLDG